MPLERCHTCRSWTMSVVSAVAAVTLAGGCIGSSNRQEPGENSSVTSGSAQSAPRSDASDQHPRDWYRQHLEASTRENAAKDLQIAELMGQLGDLQAAHDRLAAEHQVLETAVPRLGAEAAQQLQGFAEAHQHLGRFDAARNVLLLHSDGVFAPGTATLTREAASAFADLATLLGQGEMSGLSVRILVHADAKPLSDDALARQLRQERWELTHLRALAAGRALADAGVALERLDLAGRGDRDPAASNATSAGRVANRRVEIWIGSPAGSSRDESVPRHEEARADWSMLD